MSRVFKCNECKWFFEYHARRNCPNCQSTDAVDRDTGETLRSVAEKDAKRNVNLASEEVKLGLDPQYVAELDGLANLFISKEIQGRDINNLVTHEGVSTIVHQAYIFAQAAHKERAKALEHIRKGKQ